MVILTGFYNAEQYVEKSILSIMSQTHRDYTCYITSDHSTDTSINRIKSLTAGDSRFVICNHSDKKIYQTGNFDCTIRNNSNISDDELLIEVDGDDWLPDSHVFERVNEFYADPNVWIANSRNVYSTGQPGFSGPQNINNLREVVFTASHIRTWRAFLWRSIKEEDLRDENGNYWQWCGDLSFMYPMLEMAGDEHYKFMSDVNYVYNAENPINEHKVNMSNVTYYTNLLRNKKRYERLIR